MQRADQQHRVSDSWLSTVEMQLRVQSHVQLHVQRTHAFACVQQHKYSPLEALQAQRLSKSARQHNHQVVHIDS
jgi:hypothetical protein